MVNLKNTISLWLMLATLSILPGCNLAKIKGVSRERGAVQNPVFSLRTLQAATATTAGQGEVLVAGISEMNLSCRNCGNLNLTFSPLSTNGSTRTYGAKFNYPFVDRTYLCKAQIDVTFANEQRARNFIYGIYFCPDDPTTGKRTCNKAAAVERCGF